MDFGLTSEVGEDSGEPRWTSKLRGTECYAPPEMFEGRWFTRNVDIWSLGCILFEIATNKRAFETASEILRFRDNKQGDVLGFGKFDDGTYISSFVKIMLRIVPSERPSANTLLTTFEVARCEVDANR